MFSKINRVKGYIFQDLVAKYSQNPDLSTLSSLTAKFGQSINYTILM